MHKEPILVTGAKGFIGSQAFITLREEFNDVTGTYHKANNDGESVGGFVAVDLATPESTEILKSIAPSIIVHCASVLPESFYGASSDEAAKINRIMDDRIIDYCRSNNARMIYLSGTSVYGFGVKEETDEKAKCDPTGSYVIEKCETEIKISKKLENYCILRISAPYGKNQRSKTVLQLFVQKALAGEEITYFGSGTRQQDFVAVEDVSEAIKLSIQREVQGIFNIASGQPVSMKQLASLVVLELKSSSTIRAIDKEDPQESYLASFSIRKALIQLDWRPHISLREGIKALAENTEFLS